MAFVLNDRVKETSTTTGTGAIALGGAVAGFETFGSGIGNNNVTYYAIFHTTLGEFEVGVGTLDGSSANLTRTSVLSSSNSDNAVNFSAGTKQIFCTQPAARAVFIDNSDTVSLSSGVSATGNNLAVAGTVDGRDVSTDGTKLDTVETNADVTDTTNVTSAGALMTTGGSMTGQISFGDNVKANFGSGDDLEIFHDTSGGGTDNVIQATNTSHSLRLKSDSILLQGASGSTLASFSNGGSVTLSYSNSGKLSTVGTGVSISGDVTATGNINGNGQNLTNLNAANLTGTLPAIDGSALTGISSSPSVGAIGDIRPFVLMRSSGSGGSVSLSAGTTFTPSSYSSSNMIIADYGTSVQNITSSGNTIRYGALNGFASLSNHTSGSSSSYSGTWRVIFPLISGTASGGQGNSSYTYYYSLAGMAMRIS